jgi:hypothetical protein
VGVGVDLAIGPGIRIHIGVDLATGVGMNLHMNVDMVIRIDVRMDVGVRERRDLISQSVEPHATGAKV